MTRLIARLTGGSLAVRPDHRTVFARFAAALARRRTPVGRPRLREV